MADWDQLNNWITIRTAYNNEKVIYIYTCFNGVAIKEWINIYKAVI